MPVPVPKALATAQLVATRRSLAIAEAGRVRYAPWTDGYALGFACVHDDARVEYLYLNPSQHDDDGQPNVFVYHGAEGDPSADVPLHHYGVFRAADIPPRQAGSPMETLALKLTDGALADRLSRMADDARRFAPHERAAFLNEAAHRIRGRA